MNERNQLHLTALELKGLGFKGRNIENNRVYERKALNSVFYYNPEETSYVWYYKTLVGEASNHICLDIKTPEDLLKVLSIFKAY